MTLAAVDVLKILLAVVLGGAIGFEREIQRKGAGLRTITLICVGATLFTMLSIRITGSGSIAANIVQGVGFLGAGVILHENTKIKGLTTAADVWVSAAVGMGVGGGYFLLSISATAILLVVMLSFAIFEQRVDRRWEIREYTISFSGDSQKAGQLEDRLRACNLKMRVSSHMKVNGLLTCTWNVLGSSKDHDCFVNQALADEDIKHIEW
ncbi:MAG: MgtC/SapB family protein [Anaerolineaceae bacterium]|nr:MgtC/SapB family protein [Anaerolineaceae bacterium]